MRSDPIYTAIGSRSREQSPTHITVSTRPLALPTYIIASRSTSRPMRAYVSTYVLWTVSRDRHLIAIFADTATYLPLKIHGVTWLLPASAEATQSKDPQRLVASYTYHSLYLKKKNRTRANTYCSSDLQREVVEVI